MKKLYMLGVGCFVVAGFLLSFVSVVHAETYIPTTSIQSDTVWSKENSPYVLRGNVTVFASSTLTIESGVEVKADLSMTDQPRPRISVQGGTLIVKGKGSDMVSIRDLQGIYVSGGVVHIGHAHISGSIGINFEKLSIGTISSSTISSVFDGIRMKESIVTIRNGFIYGNNRGITVVPEGRAVLVASHQDALSAHTGGIGNAFDDLPTGRTRLTITNSSIRDNALGLSNLGTSTVIAENNWWGGEAGPMFTGLNKVSGLIRYTPWLETEPVLDTSEVVTCCSNILFIPGLQATRLYTGDNMLWEPNWNVDVKKLFLDSTGSSTDSSIYAGEPIGKAFGLVGVYGKFMGFLDSLKDQGRIQDWKAFGYDWRKSIPEVVAGSTLVKTVEDMAAQSPTGKVTLVAHSNGGLVAKYLVKVLADMGKESLIDSVISVAVPYLGASEAVAALLHGDGQAMLGGLIVDEAHMRALGQNMASAYSLLPSKEFFERIVSPTIAFASTTIEGVNDGSYPKQITSIDDQDAFVADLEEVRTQPAFSDTNSPLKGNKTLLVAARILHGILDPFVWPSAITRLAIVGWNTLTTKTLVYDTDGHSLEKTTMGDGTVVVPSASHSAGPVVSLDLNQVSEDEGTDIVHRNILEASSVQKIIGETVTGGLKSVEADLPGGASKGEPDYSIEPDLLVLSTHSPVELHVYDTKGNHTGLINKPTELADSDFVVAAYETKIKGSVFESSGRSDSDTYVYIRHQQGEQYPIEIKGTDFGTFTFKIERFKGGKSLGKVEYRSIPVTPFMIATTTVNMATSSALNTDFDGDGSSDLQVDASTVVDPYARFDAAKKIVGTLLGFDPHGQQLMQRIDHLLDMAKKEKSVQLKKQTEQFKLGLGHIELKEISAEDRECVMQVIEQMISVE